MRSDGLWGDAWGQGRLFTYNAGIHTFRKARHGRGGLFEILSSHGLDSEQVERSAAQVFTKQLPNLEWRSTST